MSFLVITKPGCSYCDRAKALLKQKGENYQEDVRDTEERIEAFKAAGHRTFPQIYDGAIHIGGFDSLRVYLAARLDDDF